MILTEYSVVDNALLTAKVMLSYCSIIDFSSKVFSVIVYRICVKKYVKELNKIKK